MISLLVNEDRSCTMTSSTAGAEKENNATQLSVTVPAAYTNYDKYIEFETSDGTKVMSPTLGNGEATFTYSLPYQALLEGVLTAQVTCKSGDIVFKSNIFYLRVKQSVNATEYVTEHNPDVLQDLLERMTAAEAAVVSAVADAQQVMSDMLAMLGTDIATLTGGKLTASQIPALSINDVFTIADTGEMLTLTAQRGDCALVMSEGVVSDSYILAVDDPAVLSNWKKLGVSYVAESGHCVSADEAENATKINNKRLIAMTQTQYDGAALDPDTIYVVTPD